MNQAVQIACPAKERVGKSGAEYARHRKRGGTHVRASVRAKCIAEVSNPINRGQLMANQPKDKDDDIELDDKKQQEKEQENAREDSLLTEQDPSIKNH